MKKFTLVLLIFICLTIANALSEWKYLYNLNETSIYSLAAKNNNIFAGNENGVFYSSDYGDTWIEKNNGLLHKAKVQCITIDGENVFVGLGDWYDYRNLFLSTDFGNNWSEKPLQEGSTTHKSMGNAAILCKNDTVCVVAGNLGFLISTNLGNTWEQRSNGLNSGSNAIALSGNKLFVGTAFGIYLSTNMGIGWTVKNNGLTDKEINCFGFKNDTVFTGTNHTGVFRSTDMGNTWVLKSKGIINPNITCMIIKDNWIFVGIDKGGILYKGGVYYSTDSGETWINAGLEDYSVYSIVISDNYFFAATKENGVFRININDFNNGGIPQVSTNEISEITDTSATCGGTIESVRLSAIVNQGICWNTSGNPTLNDNPISNHQLGSNNFSCPLTGLTPSKTYYIRAYATNDEGTGYGITKTFTTLNSIFIPTVITIVPTNITSTTIQAGGNVTSDGGTLIIDRGIIYSSMLDPTLNNYPGGGIISNGGGIGIFDTILSELISNTSYYVRAYATNSVGTGYGSSIPCNTKVGKPILLSPKNNAPSVPMAGILTWNPVPGTTSYHVQLSTDVNFASKIIDGSNYSTSFCNYSGLIYNQSYYWKVAANNLNGLGDWSDIWEFTTQNKSSIGGTNGQMITDISVNPNPAYDKINIDGLGIQSIQFYSPNGEMVFESEYKHCIDIRFLPTGFYFLKFYLKDNKIVFQKMYVIR
ncbi:MAG: T9SS type A sorting domain-containing protein [FCB group bacterium]|jgi:photosystem II stability/assembly factor-like uncharacterized protein